MSKLDGIKRVKTLLPYLRDRIPFKIERRDTSFTPKKHSGRNYVILVDGQDTQVKQAERRADDRLLVYEDKHCAITSKPLLIEGNRFYFSKHGFKGTMALNEDTMLAADSYQPSKGSDSDKEDGDVSLEGSKKTLRELNEATRVRKLLQYDGLDKQTLLLAIGSGVAVGFILAKQMA